MIDKKFKHGDLVVATSDRNPEFKSIATNARRACVYDRDISKEEASALYYMQMKSLFPTVNFTFEEIEAVIGDYRKMFLSTGGDVLSYDNHEKGDLFDKMFMDGNDPEQLAVMKDMYINEHRIDADPDGHFRCHTGGRRKNK